ncbi:class I SAM-dependent methyltransferase [Algibacter amylolyticus]|uniref:Class I SAM-dependent methyltransferase n=1 Tax=Algibacter amylolyticus TaxID=1608400 RepID=A0A5M7BCS3_9FLAO|nr:class I SAM-dependent methyltransferase [Algibacter amylolyticus]KAA5826440.1 class I SAM-dependent methyltransferase [Algibacter amylolyticus]MBB5268649.1 hypothetical protein [Algibacter amylolyticus]TSJ80478.1 class I SAM-dependent methyltransferase [Algibacter amylolyticus]
MPKKAKTPWPTKDAMSQIYELNLWGGETTAFYSGFGSHDPNITTPYLHAIIGFLKTHNTPLVVCDLGCGDFNIGKHIYPHTKHYTGIDIVENLIIRNQNTFKAENLEFACLDICKAELPNADCLIIRQVLQHLSTAEILEVAQKITNYKYIVLTEHLPNGNFIPNKDIISGQGIRIKKNSGVNLLEAPFFLKIKDQKTIDDYILEHNKGHIVTTLYTLF